MRGARTVVVGIQPAVAAAMSEFGLELDGIETALDLEAGLELLDDDDPWACRDERDPIPIASDADAVTARQHGREAALLIGLSRSEATFVATNLGDRAQHHNPCRRRRDPDPRGP